MIFIYNLKIFNFFSFNSFLVLFISISLFYIINKANIEDNFQQKKKKEENYIFF